MHYCPEHGHPVFPLTEEPQAVYAYTPVGGEASCHWLVSPYGSIDRPDAEEVDRAWQSYDQRWPVAHQAQVAILMDALHKAGFIHEGQWDDFTPAAKHAAIKALSPLLAAGGSG